MTFYAFCDIMRSSARVDDAIFLIEQIQSRKGVPNVASEKRMVYVEGPSKEDLFKALSSGEELQFTGTNSGLPIKMKIRGVEWEDGSGQSFNLEAYGASPIRLVRGYYDTRKKAGWFEYEGYNID